MVRGGGFSSPSISRATAKVQSLALFFALFAAPSAAAPSPDCYAILPAPPTASMMNTATTTTWKCGASSTSLCLLSCVVCTDPVIAFSFSGADDAGKGLAKRCAEARDGSASSAATLASLGAAALRQYGEMHGFYWLDDDSGGKEFNATPALEAIVASAPVRDVLLLSEDPYRMWDFYQQHVRYALRVRHRFGYAWETFVEGVLPYRILDEKPDVFFRPRERLARALESQLNWTAIGTNATAAVHAVTQAIPHEALNSVTGIVANRLPGGGDNATASVFQPIQWVSETAPAYISTEQVAAFGGSCTGTAVVLVQALRSIGVAARVAGCSESIPNDDHHWVEWADPLHPLHRLEQPRPADERPGASATSGPFGDGWHTKEGVSRGNEGGPWDAPSGPMSGCLKAVLAGDQLHTMWASSPSSATFLPLMWHQGDFAETYSFVGGINRCGAYCSAWGCGPNRTSKFTQAECEPKRKY